MFFNIESPATVTKQALSGGVTTISTTDPISGDIYTDIARLSLLHDENLSELSSEPSDSQIFGYKSYLVPQGPQTKILSKVSEALECIDSLPFFIHPELVTAKKLHQATPFRLVEPERRAFACKIIIHEEAPVTASRFKLDSDEEDSEDLDNSESCSDEGNPEIQVQDFSIECADTVTESFSSMRLTVPARDRDKKRVSLPTLLGTENALFNPAKSPRHHSVQCIGINNRPVPIQDIPFINKGILVEQAYHDHIENFPSDWEAAAVKKIMDASTNAQVHFVNISSSDAVEAVNRYRDKRNVTCETSLPFLYFTEADVKPGDTRYKLNPPIRDHQNNRNLWQMIKNNEIDSISSYHQPVNPPLKFIGDFKRAVNGVMSVGFNLKAVWTKLRSQISVEGENSGLSMMARLLATNPARILRLEEKGGIRKGKHADLVVWDPDCKEKVTSTYDRFPDMSPFIGEELYGTVYRTYLRGKLVYSTYGTIPQGEVLRRLQN